MTGSREPWQRTVARAVLRRAVRGRRARGGEWGEAMLAELDEVPGWAALRWAAGGTWLSWRARLAHAHTAQARTVQTRRTRPWSSGGAWPRAGGRRLRLALAVLAGLALSLTASQAVAFAYVPSTSMAPTLRPGDRVMVDEVGFRITGLRHGDVIHYTHDGWRFQKRLVGLPGDTIHCVDGQVYRNGDRLAEPYLAAGTVTECAPVTVPEGTVYVLGDAREISEDSRHDGFIAMDDIIGRIITTFRFPFA